VVYFIEGRAKITAIRTQNAEGNAGLKEMKNWAMLDSAINS
jgi:hypothetical protein